MIVDVAQIEKALSVLVGLPLNGSGRAADMQMFYFGGTHTYISRVGPRRGESREVPDYSLHIQCAWRVHGPSGIVVASADYFFRAGSDPFDKPEDWDPSHADANLRDARIAAWLVEAPYSVREVSADRIGGFSLELERGFVLDVFPDDSLEGEYSEHWRLLRPGSQFVVSGRGLSD